MTDQLTELGLSNCLSSLVRAKVKCCKSFDHSCARSRTAQPPGSCPKTLQVATHSQPVASVGRGSLSPSAELQLAYSTAPANRAIRTVKTKQKIFFNLKKKKKKKKKKIKVENVAFKIIQSSV